MSYDPNSYTNRKAANNDGMCPDWKPEPSPPSIFKKTETVLYEILDELSYMEEESEGYFKELKSQNKVIRTSFCPIKYFKLRKDIEEILEINK